MQRAKRACLLLHAALCLLVLAGCAGKQPKTLPLGPGEEQEAAALWSDFTGRPRPPALDADIRLGWDVLGSKGSVSASLNVQQPGLLRFAANDPLGRSLILAVADATSFTMVDNRIGHVYQGSVRSKFWQSYVPASVALEDVLPLLGGFLPKGAGSGAEIARDETGRGFWYQWSDAQAMRHHVLLSSQPPAMQQHLLFNAGGEMVLSLHYADYGKDAKSGYAWPASLRITGDAVTGTLNIHVERIYSHAPQGAAAYRLTPPPHFTVEQVP